MARSCSKMTFTFCSLEIASIVFVIGSQFDVKFYFLEQISFKILAFLFFLVQSR